ncbi:exported hypothetical protein [Frankia sp. AiPs1]
MSPCPRKNSGSALSKTMTRTASSARTSVWKRSRSAISGPSSRLRGGWSMTTNATPSRRLTVSASYPSYLSCPIHISPGFDLSDFCFPTQQDSWLRYQKSGGILGAWSGRMSISTTAPSRGRSPSWVRAGPWWSCARRSTACGASRTSSGIWGSHRRSSVSACGA